MKNLIFSFLIICFCGVAQAADLVRVNLDSQTTSLNNCVIDVKKNEPSAALTYKLNGKSIVQPIYSDLCQISQQWIAQIYLNSDHAIVGLALGNSYSADGLISLSDIWLAR
jgi:hypothetical protein